jgi:hypothetical protein
MFSWWVFRSSERMVSSALRLYYDVC